MERLVLISIPVAISCERVITMGSGYRFLSSRTESAGLSSAWLRAFRLKVCFLRPLLQCFLMGRDHLTVEEMACLLDGKNELSELVDGLVHLLECAGCWKRFRQHSPERSRALFLRSFGTENRPPKISPQRLRQRLHDVLQDIRDSSDALRELLSHPPQRQALLVRNSRRFQTRGLACLLLEEARIAWERDPWAALEMVKLALSVLRRLPRTERNAGHLNDLIAQAFAYLGNCHRIVSQLQVAARDFDRSRVYLAQGMGNSVLLAMIDEMEASLCRDHCRFEDGTRLIRRARKIYRDLGDLQGEARVVNLEAMNLRSSGDRDAACRKLRELVTVFQPEEIGWRLIMFAKHNLATYLTELDRVDEAQKILPELYRLYEVFGERFNIARLCWLEAMMLDRIQDIDGAVERYEEVREFFLEHRVSYDAALVSLDLAALYLENGRSAEAKLLAAELVPAFEAQEIHREAAAALAVFCQAVQKERATVELAKNVADFIQRVKGRPELRYQRPQDL